MISVTGNFSEDMKKYAVTVPPLSTTVLGVEITLPAVVFEFETGSRTTLASVAGALQSYVDNYSVASADHSTCLCAWLRRDPELGEGVTSAFERALETASGNSSLGGFVATVTLKSDHDPKTINELRVLWARHCITALLSPPSLRNKEMNEKHDHKLLRPVKFKDLQVGDVLILKDSSPDAKSSVTYKASKFVVLRSGDGSEGTCYVSRLEIDFGLAPLCWVEGKPVYPGDVLYRPEVEGVKALVVSHITGTGSGVEYLHFSNLANANEYADNRRGYLTWKQHKLQASFQVEGQDVFPGDTVYYYGDDKHRWGREMVVEKDGYVNGIHADSFSKGTATFRLKPQLIIGEHLVPMPEREAPSVGSAYYTSNLFKEDLYQKYGWSNDVHDLRLLERGLVHLNQEAAIAHGEAIVALSTKKY